MLYKDKLGQDIKVGDYIAYGAALGRCSTIHLGRVLELTQSKVTEWHHDKPTPKLKVRACTNHSWDETRGMQLLSKPVSLGFFERLVVLHPDTVPQNIKELLQ